MICVKPSAVCFLVSIGYQPNIVPGLHAALQHSLLCVCVRVGYNQRKAPSPSPQVVDTSTEVLPFMWK